MVNVSEPAFGNITLVPMCFTAQVNMPLDRDAIFDLSLSNLSTASISDDFILNTSNPLTIVAGFYGNFSGCIDFVVIGNQDIEDTETVIYEITVRSMFDRVVFPSNASNLLIVTIFDNLGEL